MQKLQGKNILFFAPSFFGYEVEIANKLRALGAHVDYYDERPKNNFFVKASIRISRHIIKKRVLNYYTNILKKTASQRYDFVFVVNLEAMLPSIVRQLKEQQSEATFILYMWDSIQNKKSAMDAFSCFDQAYSFDKSDAEKIVGVHFRSLFFIDKYDVSKAHPAAEHNNIDLCFIGTVHSDRYNLVHEIKEQVEQLGRKTFFFMYFPSPVLFWYKKIKDIKFYKARYSEFNFKPLKQEQIIQKINSSNTILDIQHPWQTGLTMRTIEMLGANKKLITTNEHIKEYDFYNPENILVIDRDNPVVSSSFFNDSYKPIDEKIKERYSIEGWIKEIFRLS